MLHSAAKSGDIDSIEKLLSRGLNVDSTDSDGSTPLMIAAMNGRPQALACLINKEADVFLKDNDGWSLLHCAAHGGNVEIIEKLLSLGLDIDSRDADGSTSLMIAADGEPEAFGYFINKGADPSLKNNDEWSLLHYNAFQNILCFSKMHISLNFGSFIGIF